MDWSALFDRGLDSLYPVQEYGRTVVTNQTHKVIKLINAVGSCFTLGIAETKAARLEIKNQRLSREKLTTEPVPELSGVGFRCGDGSNHGFIHIFIANFGRSEFCAGVKSSTKVRKVRMRDSRFGT